MLTQDAEMVAAIAAKLRCLDRLPDDDWRWIELYAGPYDGSFFPCPPGVDVAELLYLPASNDRETVAVYVQREGNPAVADFDQLAPLDGIGD